MARRRWSKLGAAAVSVVAALLALAPAASAEGEPDTGAFNAFKLTGSNGYRVKVLAISRKGYRHGEALIIVSRRRQGVVYLAPAKVTDTTVEADLGSLGEIDVAFQPGGEQGVAHPTCDRSQEVRYEKGSYVGTIDFRGEEGYTRARATAAPYTLHPYIDFICGGYTRAEEVGHGLPGARLRARVKFAEGEMIDLQANQNRPGGRVRVAARTNEKRGRIRISREVSFTFPATSFDFAPNLSAASFSPPSPFSGSALYRRDAEPANRWTGSLALDFPGRSGVSLTGARFDVNLVHARLIEETSSDRLSRPNLLPWLSTKPSPTASARPSPLAPS